MSTKPAAGQTSESQLKDALSQVTGALRYIGDAEPVLLTCKGEDVDLWLAGREVVGIGLIKEIFPTQSDAILGALRAARNLGRQLCILDFPGFSAFVHHFPDEDRFVAELKSYTDVMLAEGAWIAAKSYLNGRY